MKNTHILRIALIAGLILLIPLVAMQFTTEVVWTLGDFISMGALIFGAGLAYAFMVRSTSTKLAYRIASGIAVLTALLLTWVNLAVGIIGNEGNPANVLYFGVVGTLLIGSALSNLKSRGMVYTLWGTAAVQLLVPVIAFIVSSTTFDPGVFQVFALNTVFVLSWIASATFFHLARE